MQESTGIDRSNVFRMAMIWMKSHSWKRAEVIGCICQRPVFGVLSNESTGSDKSGGFLACENFQALKQASGKARFQDVACSQMPTFEWSLVLPIQRRRLLAD